MSSSPNSEERYPLDINRTSILEQFQSEVNISRNALLSDYNSGYGNITGFHLSYQDAVDGLNISQLPSFKTINEKFIEDEKYSILPNIVSRRAANIWNTEGKCIELPESRNDTDDEKTGVKINSGEFPLNISGSLRGKFNKLSFEKSPLTPIHMPLPHYLSKLYQYRLDERTNRENLHKNFDDDDTDEAALKLLTDDEISNELNTRREGNISEPTGNVKLSFYNAYPEISNPNENSHGIDLNGTSLLGLSFQMNDISESDQHILTLSGVYHQDTGNIVVATRSAKFGGIYAIPELNLAPGIHYNKTKWALFQDFNSTIVEDIEFNRIEQLVDSSDECEYIGYFHIESTNLTKEELKQIDYELLNPIGRPHKNVPNLRLSSGILYSPNCAILLDISASEGPRDQVHDNNLKSVVLLASLVVLTQIWILIRQMARTNTPSTLSKPSFWTVAILNMTDGSMSVVSLLCSMIFTELYLQLAVCAFLAFTCSAIYEMKFAVQIYCTQLNERPLDWRTMLQGTPADERTERTGTNTDNSNNNNEDTPNLATPPIAGILDEQAVGAELYTRHFFSMLVFLFVLLNVITWPKKQRRVFECIVITIFNSFWVPQIYRNVLRGSRNSFSWEFIICTSILRLIPVIYIEIFPNPFNHHKDIGFVVFLVLWMCFQVSFLLLQELFGARFFLSDKYLPQTYDYHPIITKRDLESGLNLDAEELVSDRSSSVDEDSRNLKYVTDCAICMQKLEIPILNTDTGEFSHANNDTQYDHTRTSTQSLLPGATNIGFGKGASNLIARRKYMVTPCKHVFHTDCLENWMMYKLQCPVCRNSLPPF